MSEDQAAKLAARLNVLPLAAMSAWGCAVLLYWGAVFGPLRPYSYPDVDVSPRGWAFLLGLAACFTPCALGNSYYAVSNRRSTRAAYRLLGVRGFKRFITDGDYINRAVARRNPGYRVYKARSAAGQSLRLTRHAERAHLVCMIAGLLTSLYALWLNWIGWFLLLTVSNVAVNLYPCLVQRYNRNRYARVCQKLRARATAEQNQDPLPAPDSLASSV